jgi:Ca2+-dependent lipid-binding protein
MQKLLVWCLHRASDLVSKDLNGFSDPYFELKVNGKCKYKSSIKKKTLNPIWDEMTIVGLPRAGELLELVCKEEYDLQNYDCKIVNYMNVILLSNIMFLSTSDALGP